MLRGHGRLSAVAGSTAEAGEAGELQGEKLLVDPDVTAVAAFGVVAKAEVEGVAAGVAGGGVVVGEGIAADVAEGSLCSAHSFETSG
jgi:hypothetical protein